MQLPIWERSVKSGATIRGEYRYNLWREFPVGDEPMTSSERLCVTPLRPREYMKTEAQMRAVVTDVTVKPHETDPEKAHIELELLSVGGVSMKLADWLRKIVYDNDGDPGGKPAVLEIQLQYRTGEGVVAGPAKVVGVSVRTSGGDSED